MGDSKLISLTNASDESSTSCDFCFTLSWDRRICGNIVSQFSSGDTIKCRLRDCWYRIYGATTIIEYAVVYGSLAGCFALFQLYTLIFCPAKTICKVKLAECHDEDKEEALTILPGEAKKEQAAFIFGLSTTEMSVANIKISSLS
ncbi:hypothetical protein Plhal703r1_c26g0107361 [Plasmopara halstedii]